MARPEFQGHNRGSDPPARTGVRSFGQGRSMSKQATCLSNWSTMNGEMNQSKGERPGAKEQNSIETVLAYHRRTKHHLHRFAASPGYLD